MSFCLDKDSDGVIFSVDVVAYPFSIVIKSNDE